MKEHICLKGEGHQNKQQLCYLSRENIHVKNYTCIYSLSPSLFLSYTCMIWYKADLIVCKSRPIMNKQLEKLKVKEIEGDQYRNIWKWRGKGM